jgi:hypothetical protein
MYTGEMGPMREKESGIRNLMLLSEQCLELLTVFKEAGRDFIFFYL